MLRLAPLASLVTVACAALSVASAPAALHDKRSDCSSSKGAHWMWIKPVGTLVSAGCATFEAACATAASNATTNTCSNAYSEGTSFQTAYAFCVDSGGTDLSYSIADGLSWVVASCNDECLCTMG